MVKGKTPGRSFFKTLMLIINIVLVLCLLLSYAAGFFSPAKIWVLAFFGMAYPVFLFFNVCFLVFWILLWKKYFILSLVTIIIGYSQVQSLFPFRFSSDKNMPPGAIKVMTFNVHSLYGKTNHDYDPHTPSKVMDFIGSETPDILCIQEFYTAGQDEQKVLEHVTSKIKLEHYYYHNYFDFTDKKKINALAIFTRYPIVRTGSVKYMDRNTMAVFTDICVNADTFRVFNLHLESIRFGDEDYSFYSHLTVPATEKVTITKGSMKIIGKLKKAFTLRAEQVDIMKKQIGKSPYPVIVCGDFNDTPFSYTYHILSDELNDAYKTAGQGIFGNTYAGKFPSYRIDYVLFDDHFSAFNYTRYNSDLSDHFPVAVYLKPMKRATNTE
jgi:endonuclease/exonuclease/phosphatase family metal-dependent hydrolase